MAAPPPTPLVPRVLALTLLAVLAGAALVRADVFRHGASVSAGWSMGYAFDTSDPDERAPGAATEDFAPFLHISANFGSQDRWSSEIKVVLTSFGRLLSKAQVPDFSPDSSDAAVRRSLLADFTIRTPVAPIWGEGNGGVCWNLINVGFSLDAEREPRDGEVLDAASYAFTGPTVVGEFADQTFVGADLLVGTSETLTGVEVFDSNVKHPMRIRPRFWLRLPTGLGRDRPLDLGFWADLGTSSKHPDAATVYVATPLFPVK